MIDLKYGFVKTAAATPKIRVADCEYNANQIISCVKEACENGAALLVFPELCVLFVPASELPQPARDNVRAAARTTEANLVAFFILITSL